MKTIALLAVLVLASCAPSIPEGSLLQPLDQPGETDPTVADLHRENIREITNNPTL